MNYQAKRDKEYNARSGSPAAAAKKLAAEVLHFLHKLEQLNCMTVAKLFNLHGHLQEVT